MKIKLKGLGRVRGAAGVVAVLAFTACAFTGGHALANDYTVNDTGDGADENTGDGVCEATDGVGDCTLRAAIQQVNADDNNSAITFDAALNGQTITLGSGLPTITADGANAGATISITGPGPQNLTIDGAGTANRIFVVNDSCGGCLLAATISGLTVTGGAGIELDDTDDTLTLDNMVVTQNTTATNEGGGVRCDLGSLTITNSTISDNSTTSNGGGVASPNGGPVTIEDSTISGNSAVDGGGILNDNGGTMTVTNAAISGNTASSEGGGIDNEGGSALTIENSTVFDNEAVDQGGGIRNDDDGSTLQITNSTISGNRTNSDGGGLSNDNNDCAVTLLNVTVTGNTADVDADNNGDGGGVSDEGSTISINLGNTIVAGNLDASAGNEGPDCNAPSAPGVTSDGNNLIGDIVGCTNHGFDALALNDQFGDSGGGGIIDPLLAALNPADGGDPANGVLTGVHVPLDGSTAIDGVLIGLLPAVDQHGFSRISPDTAPADIGAVETHCGDGTVQAPEECDDGNTADGDGCSATCVNEAAAPVCGNGAVEAPEECDDGNTTDGDGCSAACADEAAAPDCGDGSLDAGEECDDGNTTDGDGCSAACVDEVPGAECGNGSVEAGEECDDGNTDDGDGCASDCTDEDAGTTGGDTGGDTSGEDSGGGCSLIR